jgi:hypothetical protein
MFILQICSYFLFLEQENKNNLQLPFSFLLLLFIIIFRLPPISVFIFIVAFHHHIPSTTIVAVSTAPRNALTVFHLRHHYNLTAYIVTIAESL